MFELCGSTYNADFFPVTTVGPLNSPGFPADSTTESVDVED